MFVTANFHCYVHAWKKLAIEFMLNSSVYLQTVLWQQNTTLTMGVNIAKENLRLSMRDFPLDKFSEELITQNIRIRLKDLTFNKISFNISYEFKQ